MAETEKLLVAEHIVKRYDMKKKLFEKKQKITYSMVCELKKECPNFIGIKSADLYMLRHIRLNPDFADFTTFYSGMDAFDIAYKWGIGNILDGMLPATPKNTKAMIEALDGGDYANAARYLDNIISFRDFYIDNDLWPAFSATMNLLGFEGFFAPDWATPVDHETVEKIRKKMIEIGEL